MPSAEELAQELGKATSIDDFYGKDGIFARLFSKTIEEMLEAELTSELGYERYEAEGRSSGNSRKGSYTRKMRTSGGDTEIKVLRDRGGVCHSVSGCDSHQAQACIIILEEPGNFDRFK